MSSIAAETTNDFIEFNIDDIRALKVDYEEQIICILELLPDLNWYSRLEVKNYFLEEYGLTLPDVKISTLRSFRENLDHDCDLYSDLTGLIELYTRRYTLKNYIDCILRHEDMGIVPLRAVNGELRLPNKQPIPNCPDLTECIVRA